MTRTQLESLKETITEGGDFAIYVPYDASPEVRSFCGLVMDEATLPMRLENNVIIEIKQRAALLMFRASKKNKSTK